MADTHHEPVVVIGLGRFGTAIALELERQGTEVLAIDSSPTAEAMVFHRSRFKGLVEGDIAC